MCELCEHSPQQAAACTVSALAADSRRTMHAPQSKNSRLCSTAICRTKGPRRPSCCSKRSDQCNQLPRSSSSGALARHSNANSFVILIGAACCGAVSSWSSMGSLWTCECTVSVSGSVGNIEAASTSSVSNPSNSAVTPSCDRSASSSTFSTAHQHTSRYTCTHLCVFRTKCA